MSLFLAFCFLLLPNFMSGTQTVEKIPQIVAPGTLQERIVGGTAAASGEFPYQGLLIVTSNFGSTGQCGCVLIDSSWVLTAAHCTIDASASGLSMRFGAINQFQTSGFEQRTAAFLYNHPAYNPETFENDISLIQLSSAITATASVAPISLPTAPAENLVTGQSSLTITGWGATAEDGNVAVTLMKASVPLVSDLQCNAWYASLGQTLYGSVQICAGLESGGVDSCQGDSGGPLAWRVSSGQPWILIGLTSFGIGCARPRAPGVYTRVYPQLSWISSTMSGSSRGAMLYSNIVLIVLMLIAIKLYYQF